MLVEHLTRQVEYAKMADKKQHALREMYEVYVGDLWDDCIGMN